MPAVRCFQGKSGYIPPPRIKSAALHDQFGINAAESAQEVAQIADIIFAAVKPGVMIKVLSEITSSLNKDSLVVSIAAGVTLDQLARALGHDRKIIRAMPNTPALVNAGMTSVTPNALVTPEDTADVLNIFRCFGEAEVIAEPMIHPVVGVSGSSPAYVFMFIEAMADAAVLGGMPRAQAYKFAAQAVMGSAKMVLETGEHPGALKDMVCSPGGTTIEAVRVLKRKLPCRSDRSDDEVYGKIRKTHQILMTFAGRQAATSVRLRPAFFAL